nr:CSC1-like protein At1g69450 [Tanacetum cinerariifolium]
MILSGLLTSVGINFALCTIFFTLYSILRKQPGNYRVYAPRLLAEGKARRPRRFHLNRLLPTAGWIKNAWQPSEDELLQYSGLDAVVFMRIITFSLKVFCIAGFIGIFILIPVNCSGNQLHDMDYINISNNSLEVFSISNVNNGSDSLWIHLGAVYFVTIVVCYLLYKASFFIAYVVTLGWTSTSSELFRVIPFVASLVCKPCTRRPNEFTVPSFPYHQDIPKILFFGLLGFTYFFLAPLIIPFLLGYFCLAYIIYRNQLLNVYAPRYQSAGKFWPVVHDSTIFSLVLMQFIAFGIFTLKKLPHATSATLPLPIITLLFNEYCRKRFLPIFTAYSTETLQKKDKEDQHYPDMPRFLEQISAAYQDPAFAPVMYYSASSDNLREPLIPTAQVRG